jgi:hypothetical protein
LCWFRSSGLWSFWGSCFGSGRSLGICVELVEISSNINGVSLSGKILCDHSRLRSCNIDSDLIGLDSGNDLISLNEVSGNCMILRIKK